MFRWAKFTGTGFSMNHATPIGWIHVVFNYLGPDPGEGILLFYNGIEIKRSYSSAPYTTLPNDNRIVVGRMYIDSDEGYASIQIDELRFFNQILTVEEIGLLYYLDK